MWPGMELTVYVDQSSFKHTEVCLSLPPQATIKGMCHHTQKERNLKSLFIMEVCIYV